MSNPRTVVVDVDGTIFNTINRDYKNSTPIMSAVLTLQKLSLSGYKIILHTARGMLSYKGDLEAINLNVRPVLVKRLRECRIPYDELVMGKPLGDIYIDDLAMDARKLTEEDWGSHSGDGRSGATIRMEGSLVTKECENSDMQVDWLSRIHPETYSVPGVISKSKTSYTMDRIRGVSAYNSVFSSHVVGNILDSFSLGSPISGHKFKTYISKVMQRAMLCDFPSNTDLNRSLRSIEIEMNELASFHHGDLTYCNILMSNRSPYLIDPSVGQVFGSWIEDLSRYLSMISINYAESILGEKQDADIVRSHRNTYDRLMERYIPHHRKIMILQACSLIRLTAYQPSYQWPALILAAQEKLRDA